MRCLAWLTGLLVAALPVGAAEPARPNTLTPQEVADGWLLLFDGETTFGWKIDGEAKVEDGLLVLGGTKATTAETTTSLDWDKAYSLDMETRWEGTTPPTFLFMGSMAGLTATAKEKFVRQAVGEGNPSRGTRPQVFQVPAGSKLFLRNVKYRPRGLQPIFNGKDLS